MHCAVVVSTHASLWRRGPNEEIVEEMQGVARDRIEKERRGREGRGNIHYLLLDNIPLLARLSRQLTPNLASHGHVSTGQVLELERIPIVGAAALHQPLSGAYDTHSVSWTENRLAVWGPSLSPAPWQP